MTVRHLAGAPSALPGGGGSSFQKQADAAVLMMNEKHQREQEVKLAMEGEEEGRQAENVAPGSTQVGLPVLAIEETGPMNEEDVRKARELRRYSADLHQFTKELWNTTRGSVENRARGIKS